MWWILWLLGHFGRLVPSFVPSLFEWLAPDVAWVVKTYRKSPGLGPSPEKVCQAVLDSQAVRTAITHDVSGHSARKFTQMDQSNSYLRRRQRKARQILSTMATKPNLVTVAFACYLLRKAFRLLYLFGIHVDTSTLPSVRARLLSGPTVLLPTHKSHLDYLIVLYVCFGHALPLPCVVSGDNLNMPGIGWLLRHCGAFFIRRTFASDEDPLYAVIFREYLKQLLVHGASLEVFIEGGRSRSGKVLMPKTGVLQAVVAAVRDGLCDDVTLVPIALSFDRIVESESHIAEMAGQSKRKEALVITLQSISSVLASVAAHANTYGSVDVRFGKLISIKEYIEEQWPKAPSEAAEKMQGAINGNGACGSQSEVSRVSRVEDSSISGIPNKWKYLYYRDDHDTDPVKYVAYTLGYQVLYECNDVAVVLPASLLATVLLSQYQRGIYREELIAKVFWLSDEIVRRGGQVAPLTIEIIDLTVTLVLGGIVGQNELVKTHKDRLMISLYNPGERMELAMYRNQLIHHFVREAILSCSLYALERQAGVESLESAPAVDVSQLQTMTRYLTQLLKLEFVFRPSHGVGINEHFELTMREMVERGILRYGDESKRTVYVNDSMEDGEQKGTLTYLFLCSLGWPFIDSYFLACLGLYALLPNKAMQEDLLLRKMQEFGETLYFSGTMDLYEAIAKTTLENAINLFAKWRVLVILRVEGDHGMRRIVQLHHDYQSESAVDELVFQIAQFRKKSRLYRSRRFRCHHQHEVWDAIHTVKFMGSKAGSCPSSPVAIKKTVI